VGERGGGGKPKREGLQLKTTINLTIQGVSVKKKPRPTPKKKKKKKKNPPCLKSPSLPAGFGSSSKRGGLCAGRRRPFTRLFFGGGPGGKGGRRRVRLGFPTPLSKGPVLWLRRSVGGGKGKKKPGSLSFRVRGGDPEGKKGGGEEKAGVGSLVVPPSARPEGKEKKKKSQRGEKREGKGQNGPGSQVRTCFPFL